MSEHKQDTGNGVGYKELTAVERLELLRREHTTMNMIPSNAVVVDYSQPGTKMDQAIHHLNEALPNGQKDRTVEAFKLLRSSVEEMGVWLRSRGMDV